jgi:ribosomal protein L32
LNLYRNNNHNLQKKKVASQKKEKKRYHEAQFSNNLTLYNKIEIENKK